MKKNLIIAGANGALGQDAVEQLSDDYNVIGISGIDLSITKNAERTVGEIINKYGQIYGLLNIAGGFIWKEIIDTSLDDIENMFSMNFKTMFNMTKAVLPILDKNESSRIINIGAVGAISADYGMASYAISKSAVMRFTEALSKETDHSITVNAILPSIIDTPQNRQDMPGADRKDWVTTTNIIDQIRFLLSDQGASINGQLIKLDA